MWRVCSEDEVEKRERIYCFAPRVNLKRGVTAGRDGCMWSPTVDRYITFTPGIGVGVEGAAGLGPAAEPPDKVSL